MMLHGSTVVLGVRHERIATVVGNVEPLVSIRGPGVGQLHAGKEVAQLGYGVAPQPHGAIDVHPGSGFLGDRDEIGKAIEHATVHIARLKHHDRGPSGIV
jgi:hypothetical protein